MKVAIIDLGANSFHMVIYEVKRSFTFRTLGRKSYLNTLGACLAESKRLPFDSLVSSARTVQSLCAYAQRKGVRVVKIFGTSIFRQMHNSMQLIDMIFKKTGVIVDVLSTEDEARIIFQGVKMQQLLVKRSLIIDIGGGSSEFIVSQKGKMKWFRSVPLGTASVAEKFDQTKKRSRKMKAIYASYGEAISLLKKERYDSCYGTCGFLRCIAFWLENGTLKSRKKLTQSVLLKRGDIESTRKKMSRPRRQYGSLVNQRMVYVGCIILLYIMKQLKVENIHVLMVSTREGYLLKLLRERRIMIG